MLYDDLRNMLVNGQPQSHDEKLVTDLYGLLMDWEGRDAAGVAPLEEMTNHIEGISSIDALTQYFVHSEFNDVMSDLINVGLNSNYSDSSRNVIYIDSCSLILEDSAEYSQLTDNGKLKKEAYTELLVKMLVKIGYSQEEAVKKIENCLTFEGRLSPAIYTKREMQEPDIIAKINNQYTRDELKASEGIFPLLEQLEERYGIPENVTHMVMSPQYFEKLNTVYTDEYLPEIKDYLIVHTVLGMAQYLDHECYLWNCECQNKINGVSTMLEDDATFARLTGKLLPWPTARLYSSTYLSETDKQRITTLVNEVIEEYHGIIEEADFLSQATKDKAIEKLDAMGTKILYPDDWTPYSCSELNFAGKEEGGTLLDAINAIAEYENREMIEDSLALNDRSEWLETPLYFNCAYDRNSNTMYIFGCFARGEIYNSEMSDEELYAKMGMIIGHEISHAFDATGAQFDKTGTVANWWTDEDRAAFEQKNAKLAAYFDNIHPWAGQDFKGSIM
ncbi:MAG: M13 family metallopeptidase, partial [Solobacterium sp.]|nr:M13 family metallopeptidase [Solobacterium sp.]